jgi:Xaa-Pro aminopeptidase
MVMALEPKIVFPVKGVVGIENTFVVTDDSLKKLNRYPEDITIFPLSE